MSLDQLNIHEYKLASSGNVGLVIMSAYLNCLYNTAMLHIEFELFAHHIYQSSI